VAAYVLARVIGRYPARAELLIDAGSCALHKDSGGLPPGGGWGELADHPGYVLVRMTQEAAVVARVDGGDVEWDAFPLGGVVRVLPNHACMAAAAHAVYHAVRRAAGGRREVVGTWTPVKFWY
jgi:D-serine deaminase-like pyridoxal phosphate-dependent protein